MRELKNSRRRKYSYSVSLRWLKIQNTWPSKTSPVLWMDKHTYIQLHLLCPHHHFKSPQSIICGFDRWSWIPDWNTNAGLVDLIRIKEGAKVEGGTRLIAIKQEEETDLRRIIDQS